MLKTCNMCMYRTERLKTKIFWKIVPFVSTHVNQSVQTAEPCLFSYCNLINKQIKEEHILSEISILWYVPLHRLTYPRTLSPLKVIQFHILTMK